MTKDKQQLFWEMGILVIVFTILTLLCIVFLPTARAQRIIDAQNRAETNFKLLKTGSMQARSLSLKVKNPNIYRPISGQMLAPDEWGALLNAYNQILTTQTIDLKGVKSVSGLFDALDKWIINH